MVISAVNDLHVSTVQAVSSMFTLPPKTSVMNPWNTQQMWNATVNTPTDVYGIYGESNSTTNIHANKSGEAVAIDVGIREESDIDNEPWGYTLENYHDRENAHTYGMYLDNAAVNLYDNVEVKGHTAPDDYTQGAVDLPAMTYFNNMNLFFAGYNENYDEYYYDFAQNKYGHLVNGTHTLHTYIRLMAHFTDMLTLLK